LNIYHRNIIMNFKIRDRCFYENLEEKTLAPYASKSKGANELRIHPEKDHPYRTAIQRDRDRIIHSRAFRRLKHKQQVFLISEGDHYRTRLTHTLEVAQLSRTMAKALGLNDELVEAIALGHDLGHTPFGHVGETVLNEILSGRDNLDDVLRSKNLGGFKHNYQSLRVVDKIEKKYQFEGLNLTACVREGILKHTRLLRDKYSYPDLIFDGLNFELDFATTLEGQVVAVCDEIAQRTHDLEDGIRAGLVDLEQVRNIKIVRMVENKYKIFNLLKDARYEYRNKMINGLINFFMDDVIETTLKNIEEFYRLKKRSNFFDEEIVQFSNTIDPLQLELNKFIYEEIIYINAEKDTYEKNKDLLRKLYKHFLKNPLQLPEYILKRIESVSNIKRSLWIHHNVTERDFFIRIVADHIAGMTDRFAMLELQKLK